VINGDADEVLVARGGSLVADRRARHRGDPRHRGAHGHHQALDRNLDPLPGRYPIDVLHFSIRAFEHFCEKYLRRWSLPQTRFSEAAYKV
jgi:hypothetical protein